MNRFALARAGLRHGRRRHVGLFLGALLTTAVFVGALAVGDSVQRTLRHQALDRIGRTDAALDAGDRFLTADLARALARDGGEVAPVLRLDGVAVTPDGRHRANGVQVLGIDASFFRLARSGRERPAPAEGAVLLNARLARQLDVAAGDPVVLRVERPTALPRETTLGEARDLVTALRADVAGVLAAEDGGRFALVAHQIPPYSAFVSREWLASQLDLAGRANLLLAEGRADAVQERLRGAATLADLELSVDVRGDLAVLESRRVFLAPPIEEAVRASGVRAVAASTSFVERIATGGDGPALPYSIVTALEVVGGAPPAAARGSAALVPDDLAADELVLNDASAARLGAAPGDPVRIDAYTLADDLTLAVEPRRFRLRSVVPLEGAAADPTLMPPFPGLEDAESCRDWDPAVPIDLQELSPWDERYWEEHRGTPKAYVSMAAARELWGSRFGTWTQVRVAAADREALVETLTRDLDPAALGLAFEDVREDALAASHTATDFGGLFFGLSLFLVVSAVLLTTLVFVFGVEQRAREIGALRAIGFRPGQLLRLLLAEAMLVAALGALPGVAVGVLYTRLVLHGLATLWQDAVASASLTFHAGPVSLVGGPAGALLVAAAALAWSLRRHVAAPPAALLAGRGAEPPPPPRAGLAQRAVLLLSLVASAALAVAAAGEQGPKAAGTAFGAGAALLVAALVACRLALASLRRRSSTPRLTVARVGTRSAGRRPGRSLATVGLLASGVFLVVSIGVHRLDAGEGAGSVDSGTGGYALYAESTVRLRHDLDTEEAAAAFGIDEETADAFRSLPMRMLEGDEASCLNLGSARSPLLVGVPAEALAERGAFTFAEAEGAVEDPWRLLAHPRADGAVPAIGDAASVQWALHQAVGGTLEYVGGRGDAFDVRIVATVEGSILQGMLLIDDAAFRSRFPDQGGYARFLIDVDGDSASVAEELTRAFADVGLEVTTTTARLAAFQAVQNTYLTIFQTLGALGVLLGTLGLALVVLRNLFERRAELGTLRAVGFSRRALRRLVLAEHGLLLGVGTLAGAVAALAAVLPLGREAPSSLPWIVVGGVVVVGLAAVVAAVAAATRGRLVDALRGE